MELEWAVGCKYKMRNGTIVTLINKITGIGSSNPLTFLDTTHGLYSYGGTRDYSANGTFTNDPDGEIIEMEIVEKLT